MEPLLLVDFAEEVEGHELLRRFREEQCPEQQRLFLLDSFRLYIAGCFRPFFIDSKNSSSLTGPTSSSAAPCAFDSRVAVHMVWNHPCRTARRSRTESRSGSRRALAS